MKHGRWLGWVCCLLAAVLLIPVGALAEQPDPAQVAQQIHDSLFGRYETTGVWLSTVDQFEGLRVSDCTFPSDKGQKLAGYVYTREDVKPDGVVAFAPGLGPGGHCAYLPVINALAAEGYIVFAYDPTGMDRSEGENSVGFYQGVLDLSAAIQYVENDAELKQYPLFLFGHSWGAFCVSTVLNAHPEVRAVVAVSGFNEPTVWLKSSLGQYGEDLAPGIAEIEKKLFGSVTDWTAVSGFQQTSAPIMIIQSLDDRNVPMSAGYDLYREACGDDARLTWKLYENRGHLFIFYTDAARAYDLQYIDEREGHLTEYGQAHAFDSQVGWEIDRELFGEIGDFYRRASQDK